NFRFSTASGYLALRGFNNITLANSAAIAISGLGTLELSPGGALNLNAALNNASGATLRIAPHQTGREFGIGTGAIGTGLFISDAMMAQIGSGWGQLHLGNSSATAVMEIAGRNWQTDT